MARIQAGSTLVNQYAPPFVVSDNVAQGWELVWNSTLQAFEAVDPDANIVVSGFDSIQVALFPTTSQQVFVVPFIPDTSLTFNSARQKAQFIITRNGVKEQVDSYTITAIDTGSNTTTITLDENPSGDTIEIVGLLVDEGATVEIFGPHDVDLDLPGTVNTSYDLTWLTPSTQNLIVTLDGVKQQATSYSIAPNETSTTTTLTFSELPVLSFASASISAIGTSFAVGETLTINNDFGAVVATGSLEATVNVDSVTTRAAQTQANYAVFAGGSGFAGGDVGETITMSDGTDVLIDAVVGNAVTEFTITSISSTPLVINGAVLTQASVSGGSAGVGFSLTLGTINQQIFAVSLNSITGENEYTTLPSSTTGLSTTGGSGAGAEVDVVFATSPQIEVVGLQTAGETPTSPVSSVNLAANSGTTFGLVPVAGESTSAKTISGDEQILQFKSLTEGDNITLTSAAGDTVIQIDADTGTFANIGSGTPITSIGAAPLTVDFFRLGAGNRITLDNTTDPNSIGISYTLGYDVPAAAATVTLTTERIVHITPNAGGTTVELPDPSTVVDGDTIVIKDGLGSAGTDNVTITTPLGGQVQARSNGLLGASHVISSNFGYVTLYSNGTNYYIISEG